MKKTPPPQSLSSSTITKRSLPAPVVLLALLHVMSFVCSAFTFSSWTLITWIVFIPFYILLWITSVLYVIHWHRKKNLEEKEKEEQLRAARRKRIDESAKQTEDCNREETHFQHKKTASKRYSKIQTYSNFPVMTILYWEKMSILNLENPKKAPKTRHHTKYTQ